MASGSAAARSIGGLLAGLVLAAGGCRQLNESHCGNQQGDLTCRQLDMTKPFCDRCEAANDGCVAATPECGEASSGPGTTTSVTAGESSTASVSTAATEAVDSSSGEPPNLCGNGMLDEDEECDGDAFPEGAGCVAGGFGEGEIGCVPDCSTIDYTNCTQYMDCGNGEIANGEECDGNNFGPGVEDCNDLPNFMGGALTCSDCTLNTSDCMSCKESDEECSMSDACCNTDEVCSGLPAHCCVLNMLGLCID